MQTQHKISYGRSTGEWSMKLKWYGLLLIKNSNLQSYLEEVHYQYSFDLQIHAQRKYRNISNPIIE